mmetsp:Transcript_6204/g.11765  ORF Transcript_6204/g.11765 Transcript_6204/m.11765 type:complete len:520 (-) Transcript_6204:100-1659(-)
MKVYTRDEVSKHCTSSDLWIIVGENVYDLTDFADAHPGGVTVLQDVAGQDATAQFYGLHRAEVLDQPRFAALRVGVVKLDKPQAPIAMTPYGESFGFWRKHSPYYKDHHHKFRSGLRAFLDKEIRPTASEIDEKGKHPSKELFLKMGQAGIVASVFGHAWELNCRLGFKTLPGGLDAKLFDDFHDQIVAEEFSRLGCYGLKDGLLGGISIGLPPVLKFGTSDLIDRVASQVIKGHKRICLCISEPWAGSDVAQIQTRAKLSPCGKFWVLRGVKKWITGGMYADYFTVLAQTGGARAKAGPQHTTMLLVERDDTVSTKPIPTSYSASAGTSYVEFCDTHVPVANVIGEPGNGFMYAMSNFNKERWGMVAAGNTMSRVVFEECFKWANQRMVFGKSLIGQPVIRMKLAEMAAEIESVHSMLEDVTYQMTQMTDKEVNKVLAGPIALLKFKQTRVATLVQDHACQIFGGRGLTRSGMGKFIEKYQRSFKMQAILGGSEEIMADFAMRQALKMKPKGHQFAKL